MIERALIYRESGTNPYRNLAIEQFLLERVGAGQCILYLWQNRQTVVVGRNQNAHAECRLERLERDGGFLARRLSGGGCVYHDMGNLNFTFLMPDYENNPHRQLAVIIAACGAFGLDAEKTGRNDLTIGGRKFSGNAFYSSGGRSYHHGTILIDTDSRKMSDYLIVDSAKLQSKGVKSVGSRVVNLRELNPAVTVGGMSSALVRAFAEFCGKPREIELDGESERQIDRLTALYSSEKWLFRQKIPADFTLERRFSWGAVCINLQIEGGKVARAQVFSDSLDAEIAPVLEGALCGRDFTRTSLTFAVAKTGYLIGGPAAHDVISLIARQDIW